MKFILTDFDNKRTVRLKLLYLVPLFVCAVPIIAIWLATKTFFETLWYGYIKSMPDIYTVWKTGNNRLY